MSLDNNLLHRFGARVLTDSSVPFEKIVRVDFTLDGDHGYSEYTPGWSEYPVMIRYVRDGADLQYRKTFDGLWQIIRLLEAVDEDIRDEW